MEKENRIFYVDALKCFAIFLVVYGHTLQWTCPGDPYYDDPIFSFIYAFHMPLFMTISGMFIGKSFEKPFLSFWGHRARQLLLPVLTFSICFYSYQLFYAYITNGIVENSFFDLLFGGDMWFLKYLFVGNVVAWISRKLFASNKLVLLPTIILFTLTRSTIFRLLPFLWLGYFLKAKTKWIDKHWITILISSLLCFMFFLMFWTGDNYSAIRFVTFETTAPFVTVDSKNLYFVVIRLMLGLSGSVFFYSLFYLMKNRLETIPCKKIIKRIGQDTLGIYCLQIYILEYAISSLSLSLNVGIASTVFDFGIAIVVLLLCDAFVFLLKKNRYTSLLFLGKI